MNTMYTNDPPTRTWLNDRLNTSWTAVLLLKHVAACALPTGGTLHSVTLTLSGIHSTNIALFFL